MQTADPDLTYMTSEGHVHEEKRVPNERRDYINPMMDHGKREPNNGEFMITDAEIDRRRETRNDTLYEDTVTSFNNIIFCAYIFIMKPID